MEKNKKEKYNDVSVTTLSLIFISFLALLILAFKFDLFIASTISKLQNIWINNFMLWITYAGSIVVILFILTSLFMWHERKRRWILPLWLSLFSSLLFSLIIKLIIGRARPYQLGLPTLPLFITSIASWDSSLPSVHAASAFSALPVLNKEFPYFKLVWFLFASLVAFSRIYFALHFLTDVLIGAFWGYLIGFFFVKLEEKYSYGRKFILKLKRKKE